MYLRLSRFAPLGVLLLVFLVAPLSADELYNNGPVQGGIAYDVADYMRITNSFNLSSSSIVTEVVFGAWASTGSTGTWVDWAITSAPFDTTRLASGSTTLSNRFLYNDPLRGVDVLEASFSVPALALGAGTYWLELDNTWTNAGRHLSWNVINGPSQAQYRSQSGSGTMGSNSFRILGTTVTADVPEPGSAALLGSGALLLCVGILRRRASSRR